METGGSSSHPEDVPVRVLIVDDQPGFRAVARELLAHRGYVVAGEAGSGARAVEAAARLQPHAILLDLRLGADDGLVVARQLKTVTPRAAILLVSNADVGEELGPALRGAGASGFLPKWKLASANLAIYWPAPPRG
jgi:DNA-binding NarL/FixJ family response regulator